MQRIVRNQRKLKYTCQFIFQRSFVFRRNRGPRMSWTGLEELIVFSHHVWEQERDGNHSVNWKRIRRAMGHGTVWGWNMVISMFPLLFFFCLSKFFFSFWLYKQYVLIFEYLENRYIACRIKITCNLPFRQPITSWIFWCIFFLIFFLWLLYFEV